MDSLLVVIPLITLLMYDVTAVTIYPYLHEPSRVVIKHPQNVEKAQFGFAMTYQGDSLRRLVVGAPRDTLTGKVFTCPIGSVTSKLDKITCEEVKIEVESLTNNSRDVYPNQAYHMGAAMSATNDYFLTCAPLMTAHINGFYDVTGACFIYNNDAHRFYDVFERYRRMERYKGEYIPTAVFIGGTGWNTYFDEVNGIMLVMKSSLMSDILYATLEFPLNRSDSITLNGLSWRNGRNKYTSVINTIHSYTNVGFGITGGKFFTNDTVYAFNVQTMNTGGEILFLQYKKRNKVLSIMTAASVPIKLESADYDSRFGSVLGTADINQDGYDELLVGAPTHSDIDYVADVGAIHIYLGGSDLIKTGGAKYRTIVGEKEFSKFGSAIAACDVDQDGNPEIFVSAPAEDKGAGALYIFSGYALNSWISQDESSFTQSVSRLQHQRIQIRDVNKFGYSLQVIAEKDNHGTCSDVAVGAPASNSVILFRCLPAIKVELSADLKDTKVVSMLASEFTMQVCVKIRYPLKSTKIKTNLVLTSRVATPGADIKATDATKTIDLSSKKETYCSDVTVNIAESDSKSFLFEAQVDLENKVKKDIAEKKEFDYTWLTLSPKSILSVENMLHRQCTAGEECIPKLSMSLNWTRDMGSEYTLGSTTSETVQLIVRNDGYIAYKACVIVTVRGARANIGCTILDQSQYKCDMPLRTGKQNSIDLTLDMSSPNNIDKFLFVGAELREDCRTPTNDTKSLIMSYILPKDAVRVQGLSDPFVVTDITAQEKTVELLKYGYEYKIINTGSINWHNINAVIKVDDKPFIQSMQVTSNGGCDKDIINNSTVFNCTVAVMGDRIETITVTAEVSKEILLKALTTGKIEASSEFELYLKPTETVIKASITKELRRQKDLSLGNNKDLIAIIAIVVAIVILAITTLILYKMNFFARNDKKRLETLRESVRRHSIKKSVSERARSSCVDGEPILNSDILEDSPFGDEQPKETTTHEIQMHENSRSSTAH